jgi:uncharacterized lipoprotein YddW (UPF0748 family)
MAMQISQIQLAGMLTSKVAVKLSRGDWRRNAVNVFIERLYKDIKTEKTWVKFGLSPFGIWRPGYPASIEGFDQYDQLYADARLWLNKGWVDYFTPQLYWPVNRIPQSFPVLLGWWAGENKMNRHLWPGISVGRDTSAKNVNEILTQLMISRGMLPQSNGVVHWSISSLTKNPPMAKAIIDGPYKKDALVPASPWLDREAPAVPLVTSSWQQDQLKISWTHPNQQDVFRWVIYYQYSDGVPRYKIVNRHDRAGEVPRLLAAGSRFSLQQIAVTAVDRNGNESGKEMKVVKE